jgi:uncharacterized Rossmann fold enzyme
MSNLANRYGNETLVSGLRSYLRSLARRRNSGTVTADDATTFLMRNEIRPEMIRTRLAVTNAALQSGDFTTVGVVASSRPAARGRAINEWSYAY